MWRQEGKKMSRINPDFQCLTFLLIFSWCLRFSFFMHSLLIVVILYS